MSGGNLAGVKNMNSLLMLNGRFRFIDILQVKYLNNINEQYNRFMKKITRPMKGFKAFHSAPATLEGIKIAHMIRKKNSPPKDVSAICKPTAQLFMKTRHVSTAIKIYDRTLQLLLIMSTKRLSPNPSKGSHTPVVLDKCGQSPEMVQKTAPNLPYPTRKETNIALYWRPIPNSVIL
jgi:hypothetical protein